MKRAFLFLLIVALFSSCGDDEKNITISGAFALYPLAIKWAEEYNKIHPEVKIDITAGGAGKGMADVISGNVDLGMVSREINPVEHERGAFEFAVTIDAVIPTINDKNPNIAEVQKKGLTKENFQDIWITEKLKTWGDALGTKSTDPIKVYTRSDAAGAPETWAKYLGKKQEDLKGVGVFGDPGLAQVVKQDKFAIGFNNIAYVYDKSTGKTSPGIAVIPIDIDGNGKITPEENFYGTLNELMEGIAKGIFPHPPARPLYFVTKGEPTSQTIKTFLNWVLTDGQQFVKEAGYVNLSKDQLEEELKKLK
ncbi:ABC-type phosphate transporter substrate-binding component [Sporocytophaga myxococcoides]|uniref:ABC-type phosphate transporter substrate-binding component n=1 Tax=Sporocytophaga myxococcoides TaxID=153721 RepID=A0A098LAC5_9BACT|nr:substrate-binding domain-containing protein [Sporocytophaga myxococcoides]GAL83377.1 ABC-type phosphate transporter substrate-binding component [Sporocytophaga myxococcoides]